MNIVLGTLLANATLRVDAPKKLKVFQRGAVLARRSRCGPGWWDFQLQTLFVVRQRDRGVMINRKTVRR